MADPVRAHESLLGLSVGDALGETFFGPTDRVVERIARRELVRPVWRWTDDTQMAVALVESLRRNDGDVDPDDLMASFVQRFEMGRGYGSSMRDTLAAVREAAHALGSPA